MPRATNLIEIGHSKICVTGRLQQTLSYWMVSLVCNHLFNHMEICGEELGHLCLLALQKI